MLKPREYVYALCMGSLVAVGLVNHCEGEKVASEPEPKAKEQRVLPTRTHVDDGREEFRRALSVGCQGSRFDSGDDFVHEREDQALSIHPVPDDIICREELKAFLLGDNGDGTGDDYGDCLEMLDKADRQEHRDFMTVRHFMQTHVPSYMTRVEYDNAFEDDLLYLEEALGDDVIWDEELGSEPLLSGAHHEYITNRGQSGKFTPIDLTFSIRAVYEDDGEVIYFGNGKRESSGQWCYNNDSYEDPLEAFDSLVENCDSVD